MMNQSQMLKRSHGVWPPEDPAKYQNASRQAFLTTKPTKPGRGNWKGKKLVDKRKGRKEKGVIVSRNAILGGFVGYNPSSLYELQSQNRLRARRFYPKKKFNRFAPFAPRNTTSFLIRAKKSGGIASHVSPCPVTPAILPTPMLSPSREFLGDMAKEEWGVDGYGSMNGLIRLRDEEVRDDEEEEGSSESDVEEHVEVERRLDQDLSRFEMIYPNCGDEHGNLLENRVDDQDTHIAQLEEEKLTLKERLFLMESELLDLRRRLLLLETGNRAQYEKHEEVSENVSENEGGGDVCSEKSVGDGD